MLYPNPQRFDHIKCFFVHIPKVAGTSIEKTLAAPNQTVGGHSTAVAMRHKWPVEWSQYYKFAVVRDPVSRFLSGWRYLRQQPLHPALMNGLVKELSLLDYLLVFETDKIQQNLVHFMPQYQFVCDRHGKIIVDDVFRFENLEESWKIVQKRLGIVADLPKLNSTEGECGEKEMERVRSVVKKVYGEDYRLFGL